MSARVRKHASTLRVLKTAPPDLVRTIVRGADSPLVRCLCEIGHNVLKGNVPLTAAQKTKLQRYMTDLRPLVKKGSVAKKKKVLQKLLFDLHLHVNHCTEYVKNVTDLILDETTK